MRWFESTYGTDLVDRWKTNSGFYRRILDDSGVRPEDAVTVDDLPAALERIGSLAELPARFASA